MATAERTQITVDPPDEEETIPVATDTLLDRLSDDHTRGVLHALGVGPRSAAALTERLPVSRATVYRRLNDLVSAGLVDSRLAIDGEGHHRKQFQLAVDTITVQFGSDGVGVDATAATPERTTPPTTAVDDPAALLAAVGDEYTRAVLAALGEQSLPACDIVDRTGMSRPTVYRRLNRLTDLGVVETVDSLAPDGQRRQQYRIAVSEIDISLDGSALDGEGTETNSTEDAPEEQKQPESTAAEDPEEQNEQAPNRERTVATVQAG